MTTKMKGPKILLLDIETAPIIAYVWGIWKENISTGQIKSDWHLLSFAAKWHDNPKVFYRDQRNAKNIEDDKKLVQELKELMDSADIIVTHNGDMFDLKKINSRLVIHGLKPVPNIKQVDTYKLAKKHFGFTSNKLDYLTAKLCKKYKKTQHSKFPGMELWKQCLSKNKQAWNELEHYNKNDVLSLEELYEKLSPWDTSINYNIYRDDSQIECNCGSKNLQHRGFAFSKIGKYQRYQCKDCGAWTRGRYNLFSSEKRQSIRV